MERTVLESPIGGVGLEIMDDAVCRVTFAASGVASAAEPSTVLAATLRQLQEYFGGGRTDFELPLAVRQGSDFERAVWKEIAQVPYGETTTYGAIAKAVGQPEGAQAVGTACNRNPLPIIVPCHRVIGANGKLVGFGGGLPRKRWLLSLEARVWIERNLA